MYKRQVQTVSGVEVGGDGLRVVVDDDGLADELLQRPDRVNRAVVELDALTDADGARTEDEEDVYKRQVLRYEPE